MNSKITQQNINNVSDCLMKNCQSTGHDFTKHLGHNGDWTFVFDVCNKKGKVICFPMDVEEIEKTLNTNGFEIYSQVSECPSNTNFKMFLFREKKANPIQYQIMTDEQRNDADVYVPNYDELIAEAPNKEMKAKWIECKELHEKWNKEDAKYGGFAFNSIYMMKMKCGHYEVFQHPVREESELIEWIALMQSDKHYKKCTRCICG